MITVSKLLFSKSSRTYLADEDWFIEHHKEFDKLSFDEIKKKLKLKLYEPNADDDYVDLYVIMVGAKVKYTLAACSLQDKNKYNILTDETLY